MVKRDKTVRTRRPGAVAMTPKPRLAVVESGTGIAGPLADSGHIVNLRDGLVGREASTLAVRVLRARRELLSLAIASIEALDGGDLGAVLASVMPCMVACKRPGRPGFVA
jgi:hypothetical protein